MIGTTFKAAFVITVASAISCPMATAVIGDAAGVARANCAIMNSRQIMPVGAKPMVEAKLNINGITRMIIIMLLAKLVMIAANTNATIMNTNGGNVVNGVSNAAIPLAIPVSYVFM